MKLALPFWLASATARKRKGGAWVVILTANTQGVGCGNRERKVVILPPGRVFDEREAIYYATSTPTGGRVRAVAVGCHYLAQIKARFSPDERRELLAGFSATLRAKYDGEHYLYESHEGQEEVRKALGLSGITAMSFPAGLVQLKHPQP